MLYHVELILGLLFAMMYHLEQSPPRRGFEPDCVHPDDLAQGCSLCLSLSRSLSLFLSLGLSLSLSKKVCHIGTKCIYINIMSAKYSKAR